MEYGCRQYPGFFTLHSLGFLQEEKADGKYKMQLAWKHILDELRSVLKRDYKIRSDRRHRAYFDGRQPSAPAASDQAQRISLLQRHLCAALHPSMSGAAAHFMNMKDMKDQILCFTTAYIPYPSYGLL